MEEEIVVKNSANENISPEIEQINNHKEKPQDLKTHLGEIKTNFTKGRFREVLVGIQSLPSIISSTVRKDSINEGFASKDHEVLKESYDFVEVKGDALLASRIGRGKEKVTAIDVYGVSFKMPKEDVQEVKFKSIKDIKGFLGRKSYKGFKKWADQNGYSDLPIIFKSCNVSSSNENFPYSTAVDDLSVTLKDNKFKNLLSYFPKEQLENLVLQPKNSIVDVFDTLEIARKWELPVDTNLLDQAELDVKSGKIALSIHEVKRPVNSLVTKENTDLDDKTVERILREVSEESDKYKGLRDLAKKIKDQRGIESFVRSNYGEAYLPQQGETKDYNFSNFIVGKVRLFYPNLTKSLSEIYKQRRVVRNLYHELYATPFVTKTVSEVQPIVQNINLEPWMDDLVDKDKLKQALAQRDVSGLSAIDGSFKIRFDSKVGDLETSLIPSVNELLEVTGVDKEKFWNSGSPKLSKKLSKVLDNRSPVFSAFDYSGEGEVEMIITQDPEAILQASTGKDWTSCVNLIDGAMRNSLYDDIGAGSAIVYFRKNDKLIGRRFLRFTKGEKGEPSIGIEKYYGDKRFEGISESAIKEVASRNGYLTDGKRVTVNKFKTRQTDKGIMGRDDKIYYGYEYDTLPAGT